MAKHEDEATGFKALSEVEFNRLVSRERNHTLPNGRTAYEYRCAPSEQGELGNIWKDKPHRLLYDLLRVIDMQRSQLLAAPPKDTPSEGMEQ